MIAQVTRQKWPPVMIFVLPKVWQKCTVQSEMTFTIRQDGTPADDVTGMPSVRKVIVLTFLISAAHLMHCSGLTHNLLQSKAGTPWRRAIWNMKVFIYLHVLSGSTLCILGWFPFISIRVPLTSPFTVVIMVFAFFSLAC